MFHCFRSNYFALILLLLAVPCSSRVSFAGGIEAELTELLPFDLKRATPAIKYLLLKAPATESFLAGIADVELTPNMSREELIRLAQNRLQQPEFASERAAVQDRFKMLEERFRNNTESGNPRTSEEELSRNERIGLNEAATRLRINPRWHLAVDGEQPIEFFAPSRPTGNFAGLRARIMNEVPDPALSDDANSTPVEERPGLITRFKNSLAEIKNCTALKPEAAHRIDYKYVGSQLGIDMGMTFGAVATIVAAGGWDAVDWTTLPNNLAFEALSSVGDSLVASAPGTFDVRWFKLQGIGVAQSAADAVIYSITRHKKVSTRARIGYNTVWNAPYGALNIKVYDFIAGLKCVEANAALVAGVQIVTGVGTSMAYLGLSNLILGNNDD